MSSIISTVDQIRALGIEQENLLLEIKELKNIADADLSHKNRK